MPRATKAYHNDQPEQLSLLSPEELTELLRPSASPLVQEKEPSFEADGVCKARRSESGAIQDELLGF